MKYDFVFKKDIEWVEFLESGKDNGPVAVADTLTNRVLLLKEELEHDMELNRFVRTTLDKIRKDKEITVSFTRYNTPEIQLKTPNGVFSTDIETPNLSESKYPSLYIGFTPDGGEYCDVACVRSEPDVVATMTYDDPYDSDYHHRFTSRYKDFLN